MRIGKIIDVSAPWDKKYSNLNFESWLDGETVQL